MSIEPLSSAFSSSSSPSAADAPQDLLQRMQLAGATASSALADDENVLPVEPEDPEAIVRKLAAKWFADEFMRAMLFGDEEKTGVKPEEWS